MYKSMLVRVSKWGQICRRNELWEGVWVYERIWEKRSHQLVPIVAFTGFTDDLSQRANDQARFDIAYLNCITLEMWFSRFCFYFFRPVPSFEKMLQSQKYLRMICQMLHMPFTRSLLEKAEYYVVILKKKCIEKIHANAFLTLIA